MGYNSEFLDEYIKLEKLCNDIYGQQNGVSIYINEMEKLSHSHTSSDFEDVYHKLKHCRWARNQISHEVGVEGKDIVTYEEVSWLRKFRHTIMDCDDPLAKDRKKIKKSSIKYPELIINSNEYLNKQGKPAHDNHKKSTHQKPKDDGRTNRFLTKFIVFLVFVLIIIAMLAYYRSGVMYLS